MTRLFTGLTLLVGLFVLGTVGYAIYLQPSNPQPLGTATVEITGDSKVAFSGTVGVVNDERRIEGTAPTRLEVPYEEADDVAAVIEQQGSGTLRVRIRVGNEKVDEGRTSTIGERVAVMWKAPRQENP